MKSPVVSVRHLSKHFVIPNVRRDTIRERLLSFGKQSGKTVYNVLENIDFEIKEGEFFGILGRNGSGKSTLLKILSGVYEPNSGEAELRGRVSPFLELGVGFNGELSARENIILNGTLLGLAPQDVKNRVESILTFAELEPFADTKVRHFSSGMYVRLAFAVAVQVDADILILDEVLAVGDMNFQAKCYETFTKLKKAGKTIILVTHSMEHVTRFCDRAIVLERGEIVCTGTAQEACDVYTKLMQATQDTAFTPPPLPAEETLIDDEEELEKPKRILPVDEAIEELEEENEELLQHNAHLQARINMIEQSITWRLMRFIHLLLHPPQLYHTILYQGGKLIPERAKVKLRPLLGIDITYHQYTFTPTHDLGVRRPTLLLLAGVPVDDSGGGQRSAQMAREYIARGYNVTYVAAFPRNEHATVDAAYEHDHLTCTSLKHFDADAFFERLNGDLTVIMELPHEGFLPIARRAKIAKAHLIYDGIDQWDSSLGGTWYKPEIETELASLGICIASAKDLVDHLAKKTNKEVTLVPNAYNSHVFDPATAAVIPAVVQHEGPKLLYVGALWGYWFDWDLLHRIATDMPEATIHVVGDYDNQNPHKDTNVIFHGLQKHQDLPGFVAAADVCLIPFTVDDMMQAVNPLKVYEYLAMHKPVVAPMMKELAAMPNVHTAEGHEAFLEAIRDALKTPFDINAHEAFIPQHTWQARVDSMTALDKRLERSIIILNYNNKDVIGQSIADTLAFTPDEGTEIIVVDNQSTDGSYEMIQERFGHQPHVRILRNEKNGCSSGRNLAIDHAQGKTLIFLDSDQWPTRDKWYVFAEEMLQADGTIGAVGWAAGWLARDGKGGHLCSYLPRMGLIGREKARRDVAYIGTGGFFMPAFMLGKHIRFDEFFDPTCFEDTDFAFQVKNAGYELVYAPRIALHHQAHATTGSLDDYSQIFHRNAEYLQQKWKKQKHFFFDTSHRMS